MIFARRRNRTASRILFSFALCVAGAASIAARPYTPGMTYRMRLTIVPPDMPGMTMPPTVLVGHGVAIGAESRLDIDSVSGQMMPMAIGDYMLTLDSGRIVTVSPSSKSYTDAMAGALPPELLAQATITGVNVTTEKLGAGEPMQGFATDKFRSSVTYTMNIMGQSMNTMTTSEMWVAKLPGFVSTAFDGTTIPQAMREGPMKELAEKMAESRKVLGSGTPLKTVVTSQITGPMNITTTTTIELLDVKAGDVDPAMLKIPAGFTKK